LKQVLQIASVAVFILYAGISEAKPLRASEMDQATWSQVFSGQLKEVVIEFRGGDTLPVSFTAEGDFFETLQIQPTPLKVKRDLWMRANSSVFEFSLDGITFKPLSQLAQGEFAVGLNSKDASNGRATGILINLKATAR